jgi:multiple sugar transport system permease protein
MLGEITPSERRTRDLTAWVVLAGIVICFVLIFRWIFRVFTPPAEAGASPRGKWQFWRYRWAYVLMIPALLTIFVWQYLPLAMGSVLAFQDYKLMGDSEWVGVSNFGDLLYNRTFWDSIWNAMRYAILSISLTFLPPIILAILLQEVPRGKIFFRTIYYLPAVITGLVTVLLWKQFYDPSSYGALNSIAMAVPAWGYLGMGLALAWLAGAFARRALQHEMYLGMTIFIAGGVLLAMVCAAMAWPILWPRGGDGFSFAHLFATLREPIRWLQDPSKAMVACIIPGVWAGMGPGCLIYLAALKGIPDDYYEAADIDGATFIDKVLFIVFPMLKPLIMINFIGAFIAAWFGGTATILAMTGGGADTEVVGLFIWYKAFTFLQMGPATAAAWILGFMLIGFTVWNLRILSKLEFKTTGSKE